MSRTIKNVSNVLDLADVNDKVRKGSWVYFASVYKSTKGNTV